MTFEYEKPVVEIISFMSVERLADGRAAKEGRDAGTTTGDDNVDLPKLSYGEGVENWG